MSNFRYGAGAMYGLMVGLQLPCSFVLPRAWQRAAGIGPSPDAAQLAIGAAIPG